MTKITLIGAAMIGGVMRTPADWAQDDNRSIAPDEAAKLIDLGLAIPDDLSTTKVEDLRQIALAEGADVGPDALKADLIAAIQARRENRA